MRAYVPTYVYMYALCMYVLCVCMYVCMHVCMYVRMYGRVLNLQNMGRKETAKIYVTRIMYIRVKVKNI